MLKAIIFDADGGLIECGWPALMNAYEAVIRANKDEPSNYFNSLEEFRKIFNSDWKEFIKTLNIKDENLCCKVFYKNYCHYTSLLRFAEFLVKHLSKKYKLALLTNGHRNGSFKHLEPIMSYFEITVTADDVKKLKPHPGGVKKILRFLRLEPREALVTGDRIEDLIAGHAAGAKTGVVVWEYGLWRKEDWEKLDFKPNYVFRSLGDFIIKLL